MNMDRDRARDWGFHATPIGEGDRGDMGAGSLEIEIFCREID